MATLAVLLAASRTLNLAESRENPVQLMFVPPKPPQVLVERARAPRVSTNISVALAPPELNASLQSGPSSAPDGAGSAVNWAAEAHRAVRAFEIRRDQTKNSALSVSAAWEEQWSREHHAGDRSKTESGDWIVWINADCYQIASWRSGAPASGAISPRTICRPGRPPPPSSLE
ncbi:MAG TPA: hypothetical protein VHU43_07500 [Steroidobacteraceae bacterium]|nr:hypothetical protein [Steroidobacteraceae bacterium]